MKTIKNFSYLGDLVDIFIEYKLDSSSIIVDATIGNGKDTLKLAKKIGPEGFLYGFDIQDIAIKKTTELLKSNDINMGNIYLIKDSHENVDKYISGQVDFALMNLGYLPGGDKNINTNENSTCKFISKISALLKVNGLVFIMFYPGSEAGRIEKEYVLKYLKELPQKSFNILHLKFVNQINHPPELVIMEKI